jgi:hypothetical protein
VPVGNGFERSLRKTNEEIRNAMSSERWGKPPKLKFLVASLQPASKPKTKRLTIAPTKMDVHGYDVLQVQDVLDDVAGADRGCQ